jgi:hypothetical protein
MPPSLLSLAEDHMQRTNRPFTPEQFQDAIVELGLDQPVQLPDGSVGYRSEGGRPDDCFRAALATVLQVKPENIPDSRIDERLAEGYTPEHITETAWRDFHEWLGYAGIEMLVHRELPEHLPRWLGIVHQPGDFQDHCLAMNAWELLWDPTDLTPEGPPFTVRRWARIDVGISFRPR